MNFLSNMDAAWPSGYGFNCRYTISSILTWMSSTFEVESFVPARIESPAFDFGFQSVLLVRQQCDAHVRIRRPR